MTYRFPPKAERQFAQPSRWGLLIHCCYALFMIAIRCLFGFGMVYMTDWPHHKRTLENSDPYSVGYSS